MPARTSRVSRADHLQELFELSEERDRLASELREETRERREELKRLDLRIHRVRDIVAGRDHVQEEIPGTSVVTTKKKPGSGAPPTMKRRATASDEVRGKCRHGTIAGEECPACEEYATAVAEQKREATARGSMDEAEDLMARAYPVEDQVEGKTYTVPQAPSLSWTKEADGHWIGVASNGVVWSVDKGARGWRWSQGKRASGNFDDVIAAKEDAEDDARERGAK